MKHLLRIHCKNNKISQNFELGTTILEVYDKIKPKMPRRPLCALVNNKVEGLKFRAFSSKQVEFLDITSSDGRRVYTRSLRFVLLKAVEALFPGAALRFEAPASKGYYYTLDRDVSLEDVQALKRKMKEIVDSGLKFVRVEAPTEEAVKLFRERGMDKKAKLIEGLGKLYTHYYKLGDSIDYYYGPLVPSTDYLELFDLVKYYDGMLLRVPREDGVKLGDVIKQEKMIRAFGENRKLERFFGVSTVGDLNDVTAKGYAGDIVKVAEAMQEKKICRIADKIAELPEVKIVLISGPSSSGKTTFSKRLSLQLLTCGLKPVAISLDDYFVDRVNTPLDENGEYDYESLYSLNLPLFNQHLSQLLNGEEVELPRYDFPTGKSVMSGKRLKLDSNTILILEGIHALNPLLTEGIDDSHKFKIYVSALTTIKLDNHNYISTTDNRLIRRIVRDYKYRGMSPEDTIARWPSVRRGEDKWIFPFQENADVMFNSALLYELGVLRDRILPILENIPECKPEYSVASRLSEMIHFFRPISNEELPPTSLLREFLGGSSFRY